MAGKITDSDKSLKIGNKLNSNMVKISSSKSILSYQNGSASNVESRDCTSDEGMPGNGYPEKASGTEEPLAEAHSLRSECLDMLRKKLISDLSLTVFSTDLENKLTKMEPVEISKERQSVIQKLVIQISQLSDSEKLLLYLKLPSSTSSPFDPLRQPLNPLGNRQEIQQTIVWIKTHLEEDSEISIPKQDVYDQYLKYCENVSMKPLSTADFGKVMKQVYPGVRPRRLGTRGNSRYCYSGMRNTCKLPTPILPQSSIENSLSNGSGCDGSPSLTTDANKYKKTEKTKKKWKSSGFRSDKCSTSNRSSCLAPEKDSSCHLKNAKRTKFESKDEGESTDSKEMDNPREKQAEGAKKIKEEDVDLCRIKCEESSDNSFGAFDIECGLGTDFGAYLKNVGKVDESSPSRFADGSPAGTESEDRQNDIKKIPVASTGPPQQKLVFEQWAGSEDNPYAAVNGEPAGKASEHIVGKLNGARSVVDEQAKLIKTRTRRSASFSKAPKNFKKSYVPIQPKPAEGPKLNVLFEQPIGIGRGKKESDCVTFCEESDSQEPEEEIVRYFKHLDETEMNADGLIDQAVKNIESSAVQISNMSQIVSKNPGGYRGSEEVVSQATQQILRSQSCFEVHRGLFNLGESNESVYVPRSQSSVELPTLTEQGQQEAVDPEPGLDGKKKKISHLRILLEKSISPGYKNPYSSLKESSNLLPNGNVLMSNAQISSSVGQAVANGGNFLVSNVKSLEPDFLRVNRFKIFSNGPSFVPQSPNTRTKYFSFTPISPGPQSPLKAPSTPSASPFVSPRNTPVPRSKLNPYNDFFVLPSERKLASFRPEENVFNFSKTLLGNGRAEGGKPPSYVQACRPRSFSSTNFCRSKARRNSSKLAGCERGSNAAPKNKMQPIHQTNFSSNSNFPIHRNFVSSDSLSNEVRKFLENNSKLTEDHSATIRSQSVPLNRMISESSWVPGQVSSSVYSGYFNSDASNPVLAPVSGKFPEWISNSDTNSPKDVTASMSPFVDNGEMTSLESGSFTNEVFSGDPTLVNINNQYFPGDFPPGNEEGFSEGEPFRGGPEFTSKLDLNSSGTFDSAFASESDPAVADNLKSYLPDFEGLGNKDLVESSENGEGGVPNERKFFKNALYESGNDNLKDPVITSFKPVLMNEMSSCPGSPDLNLFGTKMNEDNQQLIEFLNFED